MLTPDTRAFIPDYSEPKTVLLLAPDEDSLTTLPITMQWLATDNLTPSLNIEYSWRLDNDTWSPWSLATSQTFPTMDIGKHIFLVRARDIAGNVERNPASRSFEIQDITSLDTVITSAPPADEIQNFPITFSWSGSDGHSPVEQLLYSWRISGDAWSKPAHTTQLTLTELPWDGNHTFEVRTCAANGNYDTTPAKCKFSVDATSPNTYESWIPRQVTAGQPFTGYWIGDDNLTAATALSFRWRIDEGAWSAWSIVANSNITLAAGIHILQVQSRDTAGNIDTTPLSIKITAR